ncbi:MAG: ribonuclease H-like domain-containing protein [Lachnospiraceae bacterium]|nr:ribonuclease H-like domain-containing protein [Lachnospiraceae bacterium]
MKITTGAISMSEAVRDSFPVGAVVLDIETKTRMRRTSKIMMAVGILRTPEGAKRTEWLLENDGDEKDLVWSLMHFLENASTVITYNGTSFDIPVLKNKCEKYGIAFPENASQASTCGNLSSDISSHKSQGGMEKGISRKDGKIFRDLMREDRDLVTIFALPSRKLRDFGLLFPGDEDFLTADDAVCTMKLLGLDSVHTLLGGDYASAKTSCDEDHLFFAIETTYAFPGHLSISDGIYHLTMEGREAHLSVKIEDGRIRHYYPDVKNYVYLPLEGYAIHKSLADMVEKGHKEKAVRENCFSLVRITDRFLADAGQIRSYLSSVFTFLSSRK